MSYYKLKSSVSTLVVLLSCHFLHAQEGTKPTVQNEPIPENWFAVDFDDSQWSEAKEYSQDDVGPKQPFFEHDFTDAKFIWTDDIKLDNTVIFRHVVKSPPDGKKRIDFSNLNNVVPEQPARSPRPRAPR